MTSIYIISPLVCVIKNIYLEIQSGSSALGSQSMLGARRGTGASVHICLELTTWRGSGTNRFLPAKHGQCLHGRNPMFGEETCGMAIAGALKERLLDYKGNEITEHQIYRPFGVGFLVRKVLGDDV